MSFKKKINFLKSKMGSFYNGLVVNCRIFVNKLLKSYFRREKSSSPVTVAATSTSALVKSFEKRYSPGKDYHGFRCLTAEYIPHHKAISYLFQHNKLKSQYWHMDAHDLNNTFGINFRTSVMDSMGIPHILKYMCFCGSQKYNTSEILNEIKSKSIANCLKRIVNADFTSYYFSTINEKDYRHLQKVFLDAVFQPILKPEDFFNVAYRLEYVDSNNENSPLTLQGTVYNKMKNKFFVNKDILDSALIKNLLPDNCYAFKAQGHPLEIPQVTYEGVISYYEKYYHPSNAKFFSYGCFDLEKSLSYLNNNYLTNHSPINCSFTKVSKQKRWQEPKRVHLNCHYDTIGIPIEQQNHLAIGQLMVDIRKNYEVFILSVLAKLLTDGLDSVFQNGLRHNNIRAGLFNPTTFIPRYKDTVFCLSVRYLKSENVRKIPQIFQNSIEEKIINGFDREFIENILSRIEFDVRQPAINVGERIFFETSPIWNHDGNVIEFLNKIDFLNRIRIDILENPGFLQDKLKLYFVENKHRLELTMSADKDYEIKFKNIEKKLINKKVMHLKTHEKDEIFKNSLNTLKLPSPVGYAGNILPMLRLSEVEELNINRQLEFVDIKRIVTQICLLPKCDLTYFKCIFSATQLSDEQIKLIPLLCYALNSLEAQKYVSKFNTGYIRSEVYFAENIHDIGRYDVGILISASTLNKGIREMFEACSALLCNFKINNVQIFENILENYFSSLLYSILPTPKENILHSSAGLVSESAKIKALLKGMEHIEYMKCLINSSTVENIMQETFKLAPLLFNSALMKCALNSTRTVLPSALAFYENFIEKLPRKECDFVEFKGGLMIPICRHFVANTTSYLSTRSILTAPFAHPDYPALLLLAKMGADQYLAKIYPNIRTDVRLGIDGMLTFYAESCNNFQKSFKVLDSVGNWLIHLKSDLSENILEQTKLRILQDLDKPTPFDMYGISYFFYRITDDLSSKLRRNILSLSQNQLFSIIDKHFVSKPKNFAKCFFGPPNKLIRNSDEKWKDH